MKQIHPSRPEEFNKQLNMELQYAKIPSLNFKNWKLTRSSRYWIADSIGNGIPIEIASVLHEKKYPFEMFDDCGVTIYGHVVRVAGHAGAPHPKSNNCLWADDGYINSYHIDTQEGLNEFARVINNK